MTLHLTNFFANRKNLELVLDTIPDPVIVHDLSRRIAFVNRAAERLLGLSRAEVLGRDCWSVLRGGVCGSHCSFCSGCETEVSLKEYPLVVTSQSGERRRVQMTIIPMRDEAGVLVGVVAYARDVTEVEALREVARREQSFAGIIGQHPRMQALYRLIREVADSTASVLVEGESGTGKELVARAIHGESGRGGGPFVAVNCGALPEPLLESELFGHVRGAFTGAIRDKRGRFELAHGGTLFLDEVGELPLSMQVKLLRVLETGQFERVGGERTLRVDVRVVSATNRDLRQMVADGAFRQDLYFRLAVVPVHLPPLRERRTDILLLANHFLALHAEREGRSPPALAEAAAAKLLDYPYPGNVRELSNILQFALVKARGNVVEVEHLPPEVRDHPGPGRTGTWEGRSGPSGETTPVAVGLPSAGLGSAAEPPASSRPAGGEISAAVPEVAHRAGSRADAVQPPMGPRRPGPRPKLSREQVRAALAETGGNRTAAARLLGVGRATLYRFLNAAGGDL